MTNNTKDSSRFDGTMELTQEDLERLTSGNLLPDDFPDRLERFRKLTRLSKSGLAKAIGVDYKQMYKWYNDAVEPSGGALHSLYQFASRIPGGLDIFLVEGFQMTFIKD